VDWMVMAQDSDRWWALVCTVMNFYSGILCVCVCMCIPSFCGNRNKAVMQMVFSIL
jgi:hypothetical protein